MNDQLIWQVLHIGQIYPCLHTPWQFLTAIHYTRILLLELPFEILWLVFNPKAYYIQIKTVTEIWDSKAPSAGTILAYLETTA